MLHAEGLTKCYRTPTGVISPVNDVTFDLAPGDRVGLAGPSGCGKSTLAQIMALLMQPDAGTISVDGETTTGWHLRSPASLRRKVQLIWQSPRLSTDPRMRLKDIVLEPLAIQGSLEKGAGRDRLLREWSDKVGLTADLFERYPHEVSEGQLQRACLARALILKPRYLICDELSSMLDVSTQAALLEAIAAEQKEREIGVLLISHDRILLDHWCRFTLEADALGAAEGGGV